MRMTSRSHDIASGYLHFVPVHVVDKNEKPLIKSFAPHNVRAFASTAGVWCLLGLMIDFDYQVLSVRPIWPKSPESMSSSTILWSPSESASVMLLNRVTPAPNLSQSSPTILWLAKAPS